MQLVLDNKLKIICPTQDIKTFVYNNLVVANPEYEKRKQLKLPVYGVEKQLKLYMQYATPDGLVIITGRGFLEKLKAKFGHVLNNLIQDNTVKAMSVDFGHWNGHVVMREYQQAALDALGRGPGGLIVIPAGGGKTITALRYAYSMAKPTLWLVHTQDLADQVLGIIPKLYGNPGVIGKYYGSVVQHGDGKFAIALFQTLQNNPGLVEFLAGYYGTVIVDEVHHTASEYFGEILSAFKPQYLVGMTATIQRKDKLECIIENYIGGIKYKIDRGDLYDNGILIKPKVTFVYTNFIMPVKNDHGSIDAGGERASFTDIMDALCDDDERFDLVCKTIVEKWKATKHLKPYFLVLSERVEYAIKLCDEIDRRLPEVTTAIIHGKVPKKQRAEIIEGAKKKQIHILFATKLAKEGLDIPHLTHGFKTTPAKGDSKKSANEEQRTDGSGVEQEIGRIQRADPNNLKKAEFAEWVDFVDSNDGILKNQYYSRRKVYERLGLTVPKKTKSKISDAEEKLRFLDSLR